jgi:lysozyme
MTSCRLLSCAALIVLGGAGACVAPTRSEPIGHSSEAITVCATGSVVKGVDVSVYQGAVNWTDVKAAGMDFAIARISDGSDLDTEFASNWSGMATAGLVRGAYQFFEPGEDPTAQATIVINAVGMLKDGDLPVTADMEVTGGQSAATIAGNLQTWANAVKTGTGKTPMIYTAEGFWNASVNSSAFTADPLWVANWGVACPGLPNGWTGWAFWQDSDTGAVSGISGNVDTDEYNGTLAELQAFAGGAAPSSDAGATGCYGATFVSQSWPLATTTMMMTTCQTIPGTITLKNTGTKPWDSNTRLATTSPRDRVSVFADDTWVAADRLGQVAGTVAPGDTFEFKFDFHAPPTAGAYDEYFGMVEEGVAWFGDPGQCGPPDTDIQAKIEVTAGATDCVADPGVPDASTSQDAGGHADAGEIAHPDASTSSSDAGVKLRDAAEPFDARSVAPDGAVARSDSGGPSGIEILPSSSGCSCKTAGTRRAPTGVWLAVGGMTILAARRRRR